MVVIREIDSKDYPETTEMIQKTIRQSPGKDSPELIEKFCQKYTLDNFKKKAEEIDYFVAVEGDKIVGIIGLKNNEVRTFFVEPSFQGKGIGRKLFDFLKRKARENEVKELVVESDTGAEVIYRKFGFERVEILNKEIAGIGFVNILMKKELK